MIADKDSSTTVDWRREIYRMLQSAMEKIGFFYASETRNWARDMAQGLYDGVPPTQEQIDMIVWQLKEWGWEISVDTERDGGSLYVYVTHPMKFYGNMPGKCKRSGGYMRTDMDGGRLWAVTYSLANGLMAVVVDVADMAVQWRGQPAR